MKKKTKKVEPRMTVDEQIEFSQKQISRKELLGDLESAQATVDYLSRAIQQRNADEEIWWACSWCGFKHKSSVKVINHVKCVHCCCEEKAYSAVKKIYE